MKTKWTRTAFGWEPDTPILFGIGDEPKEQHQERNEVRPESREPTPAIREKGSKAKAKRRKPL